MSLVNIENITVGAGNIYPDERRIRSSIQKFFNCNNIDKFMSLVVEATNYRGYSGSLFVLCEYKGIRFLTKIALYYKIAPDLYDYKVSMHKNVEYLQPIDMEIKTLKILEERIISPGVSSCILEMIYESSCDDVVKLSRSLQTKSRARASKCDISLRQDIANKTAIIKTKLIDYAKLVEKGFAHDKIAFIALEKYTLTLQAFLAKPIYLHMDAEILRVVVFQIIYTMYQIQRVFPGFKHNDLHSENIMIKVDPEFEYDQLNPVFELYKTDIGDFLVPYLGFHAKIIDFAFVQIPTMKLYSFATLDKEIMLTRVINDIRFLLGDLKNTGEFANYLSHLIEPNVDQSFLDAEYDTNMLSSYRRYLKSEAFNVYRYRVDKSTSELDIRKIFELVD
ncbi:hypothetical protein F-liban_362 [Faustovirus]|nr:hypothetical protein F-liban_362 [Faustovirus]SME65049.1 Serine/threonine-protein kinase R400 [Faustovirus ST1]